MHCNEVRATVLVCVFNPCFSEKMNKLNRNLPALVLKERRAGTSYCGDPKAWAADSAGRSHCLWPVPSCFPSALPAPSCQASFSVTWAEQQAPLMTCQHKLQTPITTPPTCDKHEGEKTKQWSFHKFLTKTNDPYINHPALLLKSFTYSDKRQQGLI